MTHTQANIIISILAAMAGLQVMGLSNGDWWVDLAGRTMAFFGAVSAVYWAWAPAIRRARRQAIVTAPCRPETIDVRV